MKNKGYTLLELLGVIIILSMLITLVFPSVINFIKKSNNEKDSIINKLIINATEGYIKDNNDRFFKIYGNTYCVPLDTLVDLDYLKDSMVEHIDKKSVQVSYKGNFEYEIVDNNSCNQIAVKLEPNLTPVIYNGENWVVADVENEQWFNYDNQEWANVIILDRGINKKIGDKVTVDGENPEALAMLVWIPRYSYTIGNTYGVQLEGGAIPEKSTPGAIDIKFVSTDIKEKGTALYTGNSPTSWLTHPAFTFGLEELSGIWVGKFETSHCESYTSSLNCIDENCENADFLRILPNSKVLVRNSVSSFFYASRSISRRNNIFRINLNYLDSHMMKNVEWGAVAYLSQSKYGKYGNKDYEGVNKEIFMNNSINTDGYCTGVSGGAPTSDADDCGTYKYDEEINGTGASTTGNITGIYDMNGGGYDFVMGYYAPAAETLQIWGADSTANSAGFTTKPDSKYVDEYTEDNLFTACNSSICYGQALSETDSWYSDTKIVSFYVETPWLVRGGYYAYGRDSGIFHYQMINGRSGNHSSSRIVLVPITNN